MAMVIVTDWIFQDNKQFPVKKIYQNVDYRHLFLIHNPHIENYRNENDDV